MGTHIKTIFPFGWFDANNPVNWLEEVCTTLEKYLSMGLCRTQGGIKAKTQSNGDHKLVVLVVLGAKSKAIGNQ